MVSSVSSWRRHSCARSVAGAEADSLHPQTTTKGRSLDVVACVWHDVRQRLESDANRVACLWLREALE